MNERCANTSALNRHLNEQEKRETSFELFINSIDDELAELNELIKTIREKASNFDGFDFSDSLDDVLGDAL